MTMLWVLFAAMTGLAAFAVLWPLARTPKVVGAREGAAAFYREQVAEIGRDVRRGLLLPADARVAETEASRRLLRTADTPDSLSRASGSRLRVATLGVLIGVPAVALGLYLVVGTPDQPDAPLAARLSADPGRLDLAAAVARIEAHLAAHPDDGQGWEVVAPAYLRLGQTDAAIHARREALRLRGESADREAGLGEALLVAAGGVVTAEARAAFEAAAKADPAAAMPRFYLGLAAEQDGKPAAARAFWTALLAEAPAGASYVPLVQSRLAALPSAAGDPTSTDTGAAIAAMPADAQRGAIRGMVEGLDQRLHAQGGDADTWLRLVRAYKVLGEDDRARQALRDARQNLANDTGALTHLASGARELGFGE